MHHTFCHHCLLNICKSAMPMNCHKSHIELYMSKQVDQYVRLVLRIEQCYGIDMCLGGLCVCMSHMYQLNQRRKLQMI